MRYRLRKEILAMAGEELNMNTLSVRSKVPYKTVHKYFKGIAMIDLRVLVQILIDGIGLTVEQVQALSLGDLIEFIPD